jgi:hypothetical protein
MSSSPDLDTFWVVVVLGGASHLEAIVTRACFAWAILRLLILPPPGQSRFFSPANPDHSRSPGQGCQEVAR